MKRRTERKRRGTLAARSLAFSAPLHSQSPPQLRAVERRPGRRLELHGRNLGFLTEPERVPHLAIAGATGQSQLQPPSHSGRCFNRNGASDWHASRTTASARRLLYRTCRGRGEWRCWAGLDGPAAAVSAMDTTGVSETAGAARRQAKVAAGWQRDGSSSEMAGRDRSHRDGRARWSSGGMCTRRGSRRPPPCRPAAPHRPSPSQTGPAAVRTAAWPKAPKMGHASAGGNRKLLSRNGCCPEMAAVSART